jgi:phosphatidylserine decarboxylase
MSLFLPIRIHPEGWRFIGIFASLAFALFFVSQPLGWLATVLTGWCAYFFRNPKRMTPTQEGLIISPGDGIVCAIKNSIPPPEFGMGKAPRRRISIFLNVFDVHVNRLPIGGKIIKSIYQPGQFFNAALDKASDYNERQSLVIELADQTKVAVVQIAGLIARRIVCNVKEGDVMKTGAVFGLIRFGSRVDIYLPESVYPLIIEGQRMIGGETVIADLGTKEITQKTIRKGIRH